MTAWSEQASGPRSDLKIRRPRRTWPQRLLLTLGVLLTLSVFVSSVGLWWGLQRYNDINFMAVANVDSAPDGDPVNWLLVGSDSREGIDPNDPNAGVFVGEAVSGKRTDTIIVARIDPQVRTIDLLSVPRDLWVPISGTGSNGRINSAFNGDGGEERLVSTVENALGIEINNYAEINFVGFQAIIDALGGVPMWFDTPVRDPKSALNIETPGCHNLSGFDALAFARSRSLEYLDNGQWRSDPTGDLGRTARQQYLLSRLADTASSQLDITDLGTVDRILRVGGQNLVLDDGASVGDLIGLARTFVAVGGAGIQRHALPVAGFRTSGGASVLDLQTTAAQPTLELFRGGRAVDELAPPSSETVAADSFSLDVYNGARVSGIASDTAEQLTASGFAVASVGNAPEPVEQTTIRYRSDDAAAASVLGMSLPVAPRYVRDESVERVLLVVGPDYAAALGGGTQADPEVTSAPEQPVAPAEVPAVQTAGEHEVGIVPGPAPEGTACG